jgi:hypothetical protein
MVVLSEVLKAVKLDGALFYNGEFSHRPYYPLGNQSPFAPNTWGSPIRNIED